MDSRDNLNLLPSPEREAHTLRTKSEKKSMRVHVSVIIVYRAHYNSISQEHFTDQTETHDVELELAKYCRVVRMTK